MNGHNMTVIGTDHYGLMVVCDCEDGPTVLSFSDFVDADTVPLDELLRLCRAHAGIAA